MLKLVNKTSYYKMWKKIKDTEYFLLFKLDHFYEICITDYISVWTVFYNQEAFIARLKESNEGLELENDNEFIQKGLHMLSNLDQIMKAIISKVDNGISLFMYMRTAFGFPFCFRCTLTKGSQELFFTKVTQPLLKTIGNLKSSETELRRLLIKKDKEIEEYKSEGGEIVLRHLKTAAFNDLQHMNKFKTYEENFGSTDISTSLLEKSLHAPLDNMQYIPTLAQTDVKEGPVSAKQEPPTIKQEPADIKQEPVSTEEKPLGIKQEPISIKQELNTPTSEEPIAPIMPSVSCKQEVKTEWKSNDNYRNPRKRMKKLNY